MGSLAGASVRFPAPAIAQGVRQLKMVTDWLESTPGNQASAVRLARAIGNATEGRINIEVFPAGALVRPFETFDAVGAGVADMYTSTGCQMGGWFNSAIGSAEEFKGLRYRMAGPGAEVLRRLGAIVVTLPGSEIMPALKSGAIDASEWIGPWADMALGLHEVARYYYFPGFHEPGAAQALGINRRLWESLEGNERRVIEAMAASEYARSLAEFNVNNALALRRLREEGTVKILKFDDALLKSFLNITKDVVAEIGSTDDISRKIYSSYEQFRTSMMGWSDITERAYLNSRRLG
jgi:TRAP-type mannitol/chloroaromatic compound transport system substrate-binding protein